MQDGIWSVNVVTPRSTLQNLSSHFFSGGLCGLQNPGGIDRHNRGLRPCSRQLGPDRVPAGILQSARSRVARTHSTTTTVEETRESLENRLFQAEGSAKRGKDLPHPEGA